ncbi:alpha-hydroxy acid oxidase [uncultured Pseudoteredinibacter sp.]|uniref:alpha-hydroxy acid oxidase n=1 Tax=uncultured Pseudoteredinibacter sp. TaxID=1641701 RepID=UPI00261296F5|nr:alpha-hydroxy acid oxidase [uncultured Pseudoteredinibacter sp.]
MTTVVEINDLKEMARRRVPKMFFEYADSGSWTESTYRANEADFNKVYLRQRVAVNMSDRSLATKMLGQDVSMPIALAPTGLCGMQYADGEILAAQAAEEAGVPFTLSTMSICSLEAVAAATKKPFWFQLYVMRDRGFVGDLIDRAKAVGCSALMLTLDLQILGQRHNDIRNGLGTFGPKQILQLISKPRWCTGMAKSQHKGFGNIMGHVKEIADNASLSEWVAGQFDPDLSWDDIAWIKERWGGPLILKGVLDKDDAKRCVDVGGDALVVSNHGGRQLDGARSSIRVLPEIVDAVGDDIEVQFDGGIRSGQDALKAMCLGAKGTYIGRPFLYGLGAMGKAGVTKTLDIMRAEMDTTMALCGERQLTNMGPHNLDGVEF